MFAYTTVQTRTEAAETEDAPPEEKPRPVALDGALWFGDDEELPLAATPPGTTLQLAQTATILVAPVGTQPALITLTVDRVEALSAEHTTLLHSLQPALAGQDLYRIDYTVSAEVLEALAGLRIGDAITPLAADGSRMLRVPVDGWNVCGNPAAPPLESLVKGQPVAMCAVAAAPTGTVITGAMFSQAGGPYSVTIDGQVSWMPAS